jgi:signal transduction histidine kinase/intracellular septation protein A
MEGFLMRVLHSIRARLGRYLVVLLTLLVFITLLAVDWQRFSHTIPLHASLSDYVLRFGFSAFVAICFLAVGTLVWLFARERWVAFLLFCFSFAMMMAFTLQTGTLAGDRILSDISNSGAAITVALLATLLLFFPVNHYAHRHEQASPTEQASHTHHPLRLVRIYLGVLWGIGFLQVILFARYYIFKQTQSQTWTAAILYGYYLCALTSIITTIIYTYRHISNLRERQQMRFFVIGVLAATIPLLLLTILPGLLSTFGLPLPVVDSQISTLSILFLPAAFGYSILRYQILVFDRYIQRVVAWTMGVIFLTILGYGIGVICGLLFSSSTLIYNGILISSLLLLSPLCWWLAGVAAERLFFSEMRHYRRLIEKPDALSRETLDIKAAAELLTLAAINTFDTSEVCLFVFDEDSGYFQLTPPPGKGGANDPARQRLARRLQSAHLPQGSDDLHPALQNASWIKAGQTILRNVESAKRPLFLSEAVKPESEQPTGLALYISTSTLLDDPLLVPVRVQGDMIGLLALGRRGDYGQYAGPDFEVIDLLLSRYSSVLENARLYERASRHGAMLNALYSAGVSLERSYQSIEEVAVAYAAVAAGTAQAGADVWFIAGDGSSLKHICHVGEDARLSCGPVLRDGDWRAWFYEGASVDASRVLVAGVPSCLAQTPRFPFAWLPLEKGEQRFGVLALTYARPHLFSEEEQRLWGMFAGQCAAAVESAQASIALRAAYERQKELDQLKDQFIMTASHELRTPLTAVQGYIDLLQTYDDRLTTETRADFIAKAGRGCDELTLMVNNIMDASRVQEEVEAVELSQLSLAAPVAQVLEMLEAIIRRENRQVSIEIAPQIIVMAEEQRLKQIILNLVGNALKYSPPGTPLEISACPGDEAAALCEVRIRDYGSGVPLEDQQRLFERFVRLERDINSPVRGAGLGLFICKQLVESMGGSIRVESTGMAGEGSAFVCALKQYRPAQVPVQ